MIDFTAYKTPVLAVPCTDCHAKAGSWCKRPSGHRASEFHKVRKEHADKVFVEQHGEDAVIQNTPSGWLIRTSDKGGMHPIEKSPPRSSS